MKSRGSQHGARQLQKLRPSRCDPHQGARRRWQPSSQRRSYRAKTQRQQFRSVRQCLPHVAGVIGECDWNTSFQHLSPICQSATHHRQPHRLLYLRRHNSPKFFVRFNQQKVVGRLQLQPLAQTSAQRRKRNPLLPRRAEDACNQLIQRERGRKLHLRFVSPHKNAAPAPVFNPSLPRQLPVTRTHGVGVQMKSPGQLSCAGQPLARHKIVSQNSEHDLRHQLFANADFASSRKPELHGRHIKPADEPCIAGTSWR